VTKENDGTAACHELLRSRASELLKASLLERDNPATAVSSLIEVLFKYV
jgi:hypothetical protein